MKLFLILISICTLSASHAFACGIDEIKNNLMNAVSNTLEPGTKMFAELGNGRHGENGNMVYQFVLIKDDGSVSIGAAAASYSDCGQNPVSTYSSRTTEVLSN